MITNIDIDEDLVAEAMKVSGARTKREVVDRALRELVARSNRTRLRDVWGTAKEGDFEAAFLQDIESHRIEQPRASYRAISRAGSRAAPAKTPGRRK